MLKKRGMSQIITTLLIVVLVLVAVGITRGVIRGIVVKDVEGEEVERFKYYNKL